MAKELRIFLGSAARSGNRRVWRKRSITPLMRGPPAVLAVVAWAGANDEALGSVWIDWNYRSPSQAMRQKYSKGLRDFRLCEGEQ